MCVYYIYIIIFKKEDIKLCVSVCVCVCVHVCVCEDVTLPAWKYQDDVKET